MKIFVLFVIASTLFIYNAHSQKHNRDYVITDTSNLIGNVQILSNDKIRFARLNEGSSILSSSQVAEFRSNGKIFESINRNGNRQFYRRLLSGKASLYKDNKSFFFTKNDSIIELNKSNYIDMISRSLSCNLSDKVAFTNGSLASFFSQYNAKGCKMNLIPSLRFGLKVGLSFVSLRREVDVTDYRANSNALLIAAFAELPAYKFESLFLIMEPMLNYGSAYYYSNSLNYSAYYEASNAEISIPVGLKYVFPNKFIRPGLIAGLLPSYMFNRPTSQLIETLRSNATYEIKYSDIDVVAQNSLGYFVGIGFERSIAKRKIVHCDIKYFNSSFDGGKGSNGLNQSRLSLLLGFSL